MLGMGRLAGPSPHPPGAGAHPRVQAVGRLPQVLQGALHELERVTVHARAACGGADRAVGGAHSPASPSTTQRGDCLGVRLREGCGTA